MAALSLLILMVTHCGFVVRLTLFAFALRIVTDCHYYQMHCKCFSYSHEKKSF
jgi:hypothetical protein